MNQKGKGTAAERELIHLLWKEGYAAVRVAGSGSNRYPSVDIIAGKGMRKIVFECKSTRDDAKYFSEEDIIQAKTFAEHFGAELWIGLRFSKQPWWFVSVEDLEKTPQGHKITQQRLQTCGVSLSQVLES